MLYVFRRTRRGEKRLTLYVALCREDVDTTRDVAPPEPGRPAVMAGVSRITPIVLGAALFDLNYTSVEEAFRDGFLLETMYIDCPNQEGLLAYLEGLVKRSPEDAWWIDKSATVPLIA